MLEEVVKTVLKIVAVRREGSSPSTRTKRQAAPTLYRSSKPMSLNKRMDDKSFDYSGAVHILDNMKHKHRTDQQIQKDIQEQHKTCKQCGVRKHFDFFTKQTKSPDLKANECMECLKKYRKETKERTSSFKKEYNLRKREEIRKKNLHKKYGVTPEWYNEQLVRQNYSCAICNGTEPKGNGNKYFHVDHCHTTNEVRGLLCSSCNTGLGNFKDSTSLLSAAIEYLINSKGN